jgi:hypothetical protein
MEALWADLSIHGAAIEAPEWHRNALEETEHRLKSGEEKILEMLISIGYRFSCVGAAI